MTEQQHRGGALSGGWAWARRTRDRLRAVAGPARPDDVAPYRRAEDAYHVLADAREVIARGWVQDQWFVHRSVPAGAGRPAEDRGDLVGACLVGAVLHAVQRRGSRDDLVRAGPALDHLWDAWQESRGLGAPGVAGRAAPRDLRLARVRDLTRWNDDPGRTRDEVLGLLERAADRAVAAAMEAAADGAPEGPRRGEPAAEPLGRSHRRERGLAALKGP